MIGNATDAAQAARRFASRDHAGGAAERLEVLDPATGERLAEVPLTGAAEVDAAVTRARAAFADRRWRGLAPADREAILRALAALVREHAEELAWLETLDNGKPLRESRGDVAGVAAVLSYYAGWPTKLAGAVHPIESRFLAFSVGEPVGVAAQIVPWNYPLLMLSWKLGPALAAGCCCLVKPAEQTPLGALRLLELLQEAGLPDHVVQVVTGDGSTGAALVAHPDVDKVAFTGSTEVGRAVMRSGAESVKRVTLELGGRNPNVIFADSDLDAAITGALDGAFENMGQACIAGARILVERPVAREVAEELARRAGGLVVGPGTQEEVEIGPLVSAEQRDRVVGLVAASERAGAAVLAGTAAAPSGPGFFASPTVLGDVTPSMPVFRDEVFGPVAAVTPFDGEEEAIALANDHRHGLAAAVWTRDGGRGLRVARELRAGTVWINAYGALRPEVPFGGMGESGVGRELGAAALDAYRETKSIFVAT